MLTGVAAIHIFILHNSHHVINVKTHILNTLKLQYRVTDPVHHCEVHSHIEHSGRKVNALREVDQQLVVKALYPVSVTAL